MIPIGVIVVLSYLTGSIPTSIIVSRRVKGIDIRQHGSGNAGGTNVFRVLGWRAGVFVILMDLAKGLLATAVIAKIMYGALPFPNHTPFDDFTLVQIIAGCSAILGHVWTVFAGFKGGKGIATAGGMLLGVAPVEVGVSFAVFVVVFLATQYVSLGSLSAAVTFPLAMFFRENVFMAEVPGYRTLIFFAVAISALIIFTHRSNIVRLLRGNENKITGIKLFRRKAAASTPQ
jgi:glycerol-3-phosphate acyltransferase PlsY